MSWLPDALFCTSIASCSQVFVRYENRYPSSFFRLNFFSKISLETLLMSVVFVLHALTESGSIGPRRQHASFIDRFVQNYFVSENRRPQVFCTVWTEEDLPVEIEFISFYNAVFTSSLLINTMRFRGHVVRDRLWSSHGYRSQIFQILWRDFQRGQFRGDSEIPIHFVVDIILSFILCFLPIHQQNSDIIGGYIFRHLVDSRFLLS